MQSITEGQRTAIVNALMVAADRYKEDRDRLKAEHPRISRQFEKQRIEALALADIIEQAEAIQLSL